MLQDTSKNYYIITYFIISAKKKWNMILLWYFISATWTENLCNLIFGDMLHWLLYFDVAFVYVIFIIILIKIPYIACKI